MQYNRDGRRESASFDVGAEKLPSGCLWSDCDWFLVGRDGGFAHLAVGRRLYLYHAATVRLQAADQRISWFDSCRRSSRTGRRRSRHKSCDEEVDEVTYEV